MRRTISFIDPIGNACVMEIDAAAKVHKCKVAGTTGPCPGDVLASSLEVGYRICTNYTKNYHTPVVITAIVDSE